MLGLAFHPDYDTNGRFFVYLTNEAGDCEIREYQRQPGDPPTADPVYVQTIITIPHPSNTNHNGGSICFGPDGNLYVSVGDGGGSNDLSNNAQNLDVLLGKILRIDVDSDDFAGDPERNYAIPADNPFAGAVDGADEIWDYGLRNPWRISFDPLTGDLYIGDVGQGAREEVDFEPAGSDGGVNYGWKLREGFIEGPGWPPPGPVDLTDPIDDYDRTVGRSITGGYVYRGPAPGLEGAYFYADFVSDRLFTLRVVDGVAEDVIDRTDQIVGADLSSISSFGTDNAGNLYAVSIDGGIYRLDPSTAAGDGADTIAGAAGNDEIYGGAGNDLLDGGADNDTLAGGSGVDTASYAGAVAGVTVALSTAGAQNTGGDGTDTLSSIENLTGSSFADTLSGTAGDNTVSGGGGGDNVKGFAGNDVLNGEAGDDTLNGGATNDTLNGGDDNDTLIGQDGNDTLNGGNGIDTASYAGATSGVTVGLFVTGAQNTGGDGIDTLSGFENLIGSGTGDTLSGTSGINTLTGNGGDDSLTGYAGDDTLNGDKGNDTLNGGANNDTLNGGDNNDTLIGQDGNDTLAGGVGIDTASYVGAVASVTVALSVAGAQNTGGDGTDTLSSDREADRVGLRRYAVGHVRRQHRLRRRQQRQREGLRRQRHPERRCGRRHVERRRQQRHAERRREQGHADRPGRQRHARRRQRRRHGLLCRSGRRRDGIARHDSGAEHRWRRHRHAILDREPHRLGLRRHTVRHVRRQHHLGRRQQRRRERLRRRRYTLRRQRQRSSEWRRQQRHSEWRR